MPHRPRGIKRMKDAFNVLLKTEVQKGRSRSEGHLNGIFNIWKHSPTEPSDIITD